MSLLNDHLLFIVLYVYVIQCLLPGNVSKAQETIDMRQWHGEGQMQGHSKSQCACQSVSPAQEKELHTIHSIIKDVREIYTDCSSQNDKVNKLKKQNKYLVDRVGHLEGDIQVLDKELQVLMHMRDTDRKSDLLIHVNDGAECYAPNCSHSDHPDFTFMNNTLSSLHDKVERLRRTGRGRRKKLRLLTKHSDHQRATLNRLQKHFKEHVTVSRKKMKGQKKEINELEGKVSSLSKVVSKLKQLVTLLVEKQKQSHRKLGRIIRRFYGDSDSE